jgi:hypothetical protein
LVKRTPVIGKKLPVPVRTCLNFTRKIKPNAFSGKLQFRKEAYHLKKRIIYCKKRLSSSACGKLKQALMSGGPTHLKQ